MFHTATRVISCSDLSVLFSQLLFAIGSTLVSRPQSDVATNTAYLLIKCIDKQKLKNIKKSLPKNEKC